MRIDDSLAIASCDFCDPELPSEITLVLDNSHQLERLPGRTRLQPAGEVAAAQNAAMKFNLSADGQVNIADFAAFRELRLAWSGCNEPATEPNAPDPNL